MPMTPDQKAYRREARYHGTNVARSLDLMLTAQREAGHWKPVDAEREKFWLDRAWKHQVYAIVQARKAAHAALKSVWWGQRSSIRP